MTAGIFQLRRQRRVSSSAERGSLRVHLQIIWALMIRELATRYGRDNAGFLWAVGEPLIFCFGAFAMWVSIRPAYEHGIRILPFVVTGYLPLTLLRHMMVQAMYCVKANSGLLYHRKIAVLHLFFSRIVLEFAAITIAFIAVLAILSPYGLVSFPRRPGLAYGAWLLEAWISMAMAMILGALSQITELVEKVVPVLIYVLMPISGTYFMAAWLPPRIRDALLVLPFLHCNEMLRAAFFSDSIKTYYNVPYVIMCAMIMTFFGLALMQFVRDKIEVE
ncbi:MAG: ABC transporter permease [Caulobacteraceae bacterium]